MQFNTLKYLKIQKKTNLLHSSLISILPSTPSSASRDDSLGQDAEAAADDDTAQLVLFSPAHGRDQSSLEM